MERQELAQRLLVLASTLVDDTQSDSRDRRAYDPDAEFEARLKELGALAEAFKAKHAGLIAALTQAEKAKKEAEAAIKDVWMPWKRESGYEKMRREVLKQAQQCMDIGDKLEDFGDDLEGQMRLVKRESSQVAYKEFMKVLVSTLNDAELKKFVLNLDKYMRKVTTELKTGIDVLDSQVQDFREEAKAMAKERDIELKVGSHNREAGLSDILGVVKDVVPKLVRKVTGLFTALYNRIFKAGQVLNAMENAIDSVIAKANRAL